MSVSGIGGSMGGGISQEMLQQLRSAREQGMGVDETASFLVEQNDGDGDGLLSLEESGFSEDMFNSIDADGDSLLSAEEISKDMQEKMDQMREMMGELNMMMLGAEESSDAVSALTEENSSGSSEENSSGSSGSGSAGSSGESEEEEYDELDLNQDGVVSFSELMVAFQSGQYDLGALLGTGEGSDGISSYLQQMAMSAYDSMEL